MMRVMQLMPRTCKDRRLGLGPMHGVSGAFSFPFKKMRDGDSAIGGTFAFSSRDLKEEEGHVRGVYLNFHRPADAEREKNEEAGRKMKRTALFGLALAVNCMSPEETECNCLFMKSNKMIYV
jgi:hypothetical protein